MRSLVPDSLQFAPAFKTWTMPGRRKERLKEKDGGHMRFLCRCFAQSPKVQIIFCVGRDRNDDQATRPLFHSRKGRIQLEPKYNISKSAGVEFDRSRASRPRVHLLSNLTPSLRWLRGLLQHLQPHSRCSCLQDLGEGQVLAA